MTRSPAARDNVWPGDEHMSARTHDTARHVRFLAMAAALSLTVGCAARATTPESIPGSLITDTRDLTPRRVQVPDTRLERGKEPPRTAKGTMFMMRRLFLKSLTPVAVTVSMLATAPIHAFQQLDAQRQDRPVVRRRAPDALRRGASPFVRTELYFGTAKPVGAVTEAEFNLFLDAVVTPLFPDGLTVIKADGQFKGENGETIKEDSFVLILLYPLDGHKTSSKSIDAIRQAST